MKTYITFGQIHTHSINGITLDKDSVAVLEHDKEESGHEIAMQLFDAKFHQAVSRETVTGEFLSYFPRGLIRIGFHSLNKENTNV